MKIMIIIDSTKKIKEFIRNYDIKNDRLVFLFYFDQLDSIPLP